MVPRTTGTIIVALLTPELGVLLGAGCGQGPMTKSTGDPVISAKLKISVLFNAPVDEARRSNC